MKILTLENTAYDLDRVPDEVEDLRYCVFDAGNEEFQDYYCSYICGVHGDFLKPFT